MIEVYDVSTGASLFQQPLPARFRLVDVDGGIVVLLRDNRIMLLRLHGSGPGRVYAPVGSRARSEGRMSPRGTWIAGEAEVAADDAT